MKLLKSIAALAFMSFTCIVQQVYALDDPSFSLNANNSQKGTLTMNELFIGGVKSHKNVKVEFDFNNSTFIILQATPADNSIPAQAVETQEAGGLSVGLRGCVSLDRSVTCHLLLTSNEFDRRINFCGRGADGCGVSTAFDELGNQYSPIKVSLANTEDGRELDKQLIADVTIEATIVFDNLSTLANEFSLLDLGIHDGANAHRVKFRDVAF